MTRSRVVRVLPDAPAIDKTFDYLVPAELDERVRVGTVVRVALAGRRVGAWVVAEDAEPPPGVQPVALAKVTGWGPDPDVVGLAAWAAWRWAGPQATFLRSATGPRAVPELPAPSRPPTAGRGGGAEHPRVSAAFDVPRAVVRVAPADDPYPLVVAAARRGDALVLAPAARTAASLIRRLAGDGVDAVRYPDGWARARAGATVVGSRAAAWAPMPRLAAVVVLDEHDEVYQEERAPTWHARDVVIERARRRGVPCVLVSPMPTLEALEGGVLQVPTRSRERDGWPRVEVVDRREDDPVRSGLFSARVVDLLRAPGRVVCVLNRTGRSRLLACSRCGAVGTCERCGAAAVQPAPGVLECRRCGATRPVVCESCGSTALKNLRAGVSRVREELEALVREPVGEVSATSAEGAVGDERVLVGTEAVLHRVHDAATVVFLDMDQELLAPRYRAGEEALALLVRAARLVGRRDGPGRVVVQTRQPDHEVLRAAVHGDPSLLTDAERDWRALLRLPPSHALAEVRGPAADAFVAALPPTPALEIAGPRDGTWLLRAPNHGVLCDALAATPRPAGRVRVSVDPLRI